MKSSSWLRDPMLHFLAIGSMIFVLYEFSFNDGAEENDRQILVDSRQIENLRNNWLSQRGAEPDASVMDLLIKDYVRSEVMFREAKRLGLAEDDIIIRRRLIQKMEFLSSNIRQLALPDEEEIEKYYAEHKASFTVAEKRSFTHIYFSKEKRDADYLNDAENILSGDEEILNVEQPWRLGDNFILQYQYEQISQSGTARVFGEKFAHTLFQLESGSWLGPVESEYGGHLVYIDEISPEHVPDRESISKALIDEYMDEQLEILREKNYQQILSAYTVIVDEKND